MESDFMEIIKQLLTKKTVNIYNIKVEIIDIIEIEYQEYNLTLKFGEMCICCGIYTNTDIKLQKGNIIKFLQLSLFKTDSLIKCNIKIFDIVSNENDVTKQELNNININEGECHINLGLETYNLEPYNLPNYFSFINNSEDNYLEDIFIITKKI